MIPPKAKQSIVKQKTVKQEPPEKLKESELGDEVVISQPPVQYTDFTKKIKKNVDSRDACTQTDRSDYMLIKQKQKQREILEMIKTGQKLPQGVSPQQLLQNFMNQSAMQ